MNPNSPGHRHPIRLSVLDRLVSAEPFARGDAFAYEKSVEALKIAIRRDLEWLFNTRLPIEEIPDGSKDLENSVFCFGIPDVGSVNLGDPDNRRGLARIMEAAVARHETRLAEVRVDAKPAPPGGLPKLSFVISAKLLVEPLEEQITFDAELIVADRRYKVSGGA